MPWNKFEDVPDTIKTHQEASLDLSAANKWGEIYDAVKANKELENPAAVAWSAWAKLYRKEEGRWVKRDKEAGIGEVTAGEENTAKNTISGNPLVITSDMLNKISFDDGDVERWVTLSDGRRFPILTPEGKERIKAAKAKEKAEKKPDKNAKPREVATDIDADTRKAVEMVAAVKEESDYLAGMASSKKKELDETLDKYQDVFGKAGQKAFDLGNKMVTLDLDAQEYVKWKPVIDKLKEKLTNEQKAYLGKLMSMPEMKTIASKRTVRVVEKFLNIVIRKAEEATEDTQRVERFLSELREMTDYTVEHQKRLDELENEFIEVVRMMREEKETI